MTFKVPEKFRVRSGRAGTDESYGNNGFFFVPTRPGQPPLKVIASDGESWRPVFGYEGLYEVSTIGKVRSLGQEVEMPRGGVRVHDPRVIAQELLDSGYLRVSLCRGALIEKRLIHILVADAFIKKDENSDEVNHRDGVKTNNHVENLEWCSKQYNVHHAIENGLRSGIKAEDVEQIKAMLDAGMTPTQVALAVGKSRQTISDIKFGRHRDLSPLPPTQWEGVPHWEHVSASLPGRCPTWDEMCKVKALFWSDDDCVMQLHPPRSEWVNNHPFCLHLWRPVGHEIPAPPSLLVGYKDVGVMDLKGAA